MANSFKSNDSFLRKLAVGAAVTISTMDDLTNSGFDPIELERGSSGFKIWKNIKIKRLRVPDILCLKTGLRIESRGKIKPEISMSHSLKDPTRTWDAGMKDDDYVSIVVFKQNQESPLDIEQISPIHYISVRDMRTSFRLEHIVITKPKGSDEGSEIRIIWPSAYANYDSVVEMIDQELVRLRPLK